MFVKIAYLITFLPILRLQICKLENINTGIKILLPTVHNLYVTNFMSATLN